MSPRNATLLVLGVVAVSFSAPLIRYARDAGADDLAIAFYRNAFAAAALLPVALSRHRAELRSLSRRQAGGLALAGILLALHFGTWIPSVTLTTVAASTVLVTTQPVFAAAGERLLFGERVRRTAVVGIGVALAGAVLISGGDFRASSRAFAGDLLALAGAVCAAGYFLVGRALRQRLSLLAYVGVVYAICAVLLAVAMLVSGTPFTGHEARAWGLFALMALGPQILGHTTFNYLVRDVDVTVVAVAVMGEPVGATLLSLGFFGEVPPLSAMLGGALILAGIYLALTAQARRQLGVPVE